MSIFNVTNELKSVSPAQPVRRTRIVDLSEVGYELDEEQLRFAVGGLRSDSAGSCTAPGACDDE